MGSYPQLLQMMKLLLLTFLILASVTFIAEGAISHPPNCLEMLREMIKIINMSERDFRRMSHKEFPTCTRPDIKGKPWCICAVVDSESHHSIAEMGCTSKAYYLARIKEDKHFKDCSWPYSFFKSVV